MSSRAKRPPTTLDCKRERSNSREAKLWRVVFQRAILDAFASPGKGGATVRDTVDAQDWLAGGGRDLALACEGADLDVGMVETWAADMAAQGWPRTRFIIWKRIARAMLRGGKM